NESYGFHRDEGETIVIEKRKLGTSGIVSGGSLKKSGLLVCGVLLALLGGVIHPSDSQASSRMVLLSNDFKNHGTIHNEQVFSGFGCSGKNISPELHWKGIPKGTRSLALTAYDPNAPTGSGWWHWVLIDLPATTTHLAKNAGTSDGASLPKGSFQAVTDFGKKGYGGLVRLLEIVRITTFLPSMP
ncbi:phosphatidylethanolamine binding protein, partial [mine drainage metagenome]